MEYKNKEYSKEDFDKAYASLKEKMVKENTGLRIIYQNHKPYGIRDDGGFWLFFPNISKFSGQEERYREETEAQFRLADFLLSSLKMGHIK